MTNNQSDSANTIRFLAKMKPYLQQKYHLVEMGVFGSYARQQQTATSDLDILVEFEDNTPNLMELKKELQKELQKELNIPVDICRKKYINPIFKSHILAEVTYV